DQETGQGPATIAFQERRPVILQDWDVEPSVAPWKSRAAEHGLRSSASFPLVQEGNSRAVLSLYSGKSLFFDDEILKLLASIVDDTGFALDKMAETRRRISAEEDREQLLQTLDLHAQELEVLVVMRTAHLAMLSTAIEQSPASVAITDAAGLIDYVNPYFLKITGYLKDEIIGKNMNILNSGEMPKEFYHQMWDTLKAGKAWFGEICNKAKDGHLFWEHASISPVFDHKGDISQFVSVKDDITDRKFRDEELKLAQEALITVKDRLAMAAKAGTVGIWDYDIINNQLIWDEQMFRLYGTTSGQFSGTLDAWQNGMHPEDRERTEEEHRAALRGDHDFDTEFRVLWPDGTVRTIRALAAVSRDSSGHAIKMVGTNWDITTEKTKIEELRRANEDLDKAARAKSAFLSNMSHEIRTPMNAVLGFAQLLEREKGTTARQREYIANIKGAGDHLLALINEILDLASIESGRTQLSEESLDLRQFIDELGAMFRIQTDEKGLALDCVVDPEVPYQVLTDTKRLRQILINLLGNAVKFTSFGKISLTLHSELLGNKGRGQRHRLSIDVTDSGPGIGAEDLGRIFEAFEQTALGASKGGTGLGLAISRSIARTMGGDIEAYSEPGLGSRFRLSFEAKPTEVTSTVHAMERRVLRISAGQEGCRILIVDDREENRAILRDLLTAIGFDTREARDGQEALDTLEAWAPDAVLMDIQMPGMGGLEAIRRIRASNRYQALKVIVLSASALDFNRRDAIEAGADGFISKPFREAELFAILKEALGLEYDEETIEAEDGLHEADLVDSASLAPELVVRLRTAAHEAAYDQIGEILSSMESEHVRSARLLRDRLENYDYRGMVEFLDAQESSHG
ncbi:MAG: PAS domain-containing protein, partial [Spirochaetota bacterium]